MESIEQQQRILDEYFDGNYDKSFLQDKFVQNIDYEQIKSNLIKLSDLQNRKPSTEQEPVTSDLNQEIYLLQQSTIKQFADFIDKCFPMITFSLRVNTPRLNEKEYQHIFNAFDNILTQLLDKLQPHKLLKSSVSKELNTPYQIGKYLSKNK